MEESLSDKWQAKLEALMNTKFNGYRNGCFEIEQRGSSVHIKLGTMYESPEFNLNTMQAIVAMFKGNDLDTSAFSENGCETCDFGSAYGFEIEVKNCPEGVLANPE